MRHALVAESSKRELREKEMALSKECSELEDKISEMEVYTKDIVKQDEEERAQVKEDHSNFKKEKGDEIFAIKDEIDTCL